jgi:hypothetical protein
MCFQGNTWCSITSSFTMRNGTWFSGFFLSFLSERLRQRTVRVANIWPHVTRRTREKKEVVSVCRTIFNTSNKGIAKHHIDKRKFIQLIKPEFLFNSYVSTKSFRGFFLYLYIDLILNFITSEDITLFVYIGFDIQTSFSTFQTVISLLTMNIHTVWVW